MTTTIYYTRPLYQQVFSFIGAGNDIERIKQQLKHWVPDAHVLSIH